MYGLLVLQFNSFLQPLLIFVAIPFSFVGLFPGLLATDNDLSFFVLIGITGLLGIVVNNTIMLLDYANQVRAEGKVSYTEAMKQAVKVRFRPLLTTSVTTIAGLVPLALSDPFWESIAYSIIFGLFASTTMVIFVFPAYYAAVEFLRNRVFHKLFPALKEK
jgi:multidrug efflux pump subunit AcrB